MTLIYMNEMNESPKICSMVYSIHILGSWKIQVNAKSVSIPKPQNAEYFVNLNVFMCSK